MRSLLIILSLLVVVPASSQKAYLFVKKGIKKKRTYVEGDQVMLRLGGDTIVGGLITHLRDDTIFLVGRPIPVSRVKAVVVRTKKDRKKFYIPPNQLLLITGGVALTTAGITLSNQAPFNEALVAGATIGYAPIAIGYLTSKIKTSRREFRMGKKYRLHLIDFHLPRRRAF